MIVTAKCLFCDAKIEGERDYMVSGKNIPFWKSGRIPNQLKKRPEWQWAWNGLDDIIFYLCPNHTGDEDYDRAFDIVDKLAIYRR